MSTIWTWFKANWKTNLAAVAAFAWSVPQFVTALQQWQAGQAVNWHGAIISLIVAAGLAVSKDATNHSTAAQVQQATVKAAAAAK